MSIPIKPLMDRILAVREEVQTKTASGLFLPENSKEKSVIAKVLAVGPDVKNVKVDDRVVYKEYTTTDLRVDSVEYLIVKEEDVLATIA